MNTAGKRLWFLALITSLFFCSTAVSEDIVFGAPPWEIPENGDDIYQPLVEHLSGLISKKIVYTPSKSWLEYQRDLRNGKFDLAFDSPHLVAWRMSNAQHQCLVNLPSPLQYYILVEKNSASFAKLEDLVNKKVCAMPPLSLGTLLFLNSFPNPVRQPLMESVSGGDAAVFKAFKAGKCQAAVVRSAYLDKQLGGADKAAVKIIHATDELPNMALSASEEISADDREKIIRSLTQDPQGIEATAALRKHFNEDAEALKRSNSIDYIVYNRFVLEGVIFGW